MLRCNAESAAAAPGIAAARDNTVAGFAAPSPFFQFVVTFKTGMVTTALDLVAPRSETRSSSACRRDVSMGA